MNIAKHMKGREYWADWACAVLQGAGGSIQVNEYRHGDRLLKALHYAQKIDNATGAKT